MAKRKHRSTLEQVNNKFKAESQKQCYLVYCATALALWRHWNKKRLDNMGQGKRIKYGIMEDK